MPCFGTITSTRAVQRTVYMIHNCKKKKKKKVLQLCTLAPALCLLLSQAGRLAEYLVLHVIGICLQRLYRVVHKRCVLQVVVQH